MKFLNKALERGLTPGNIISWLSLQSLTTLGSIWGTWRLYIKAHLLGVEIGKGVRAHGPVGLLRWPGGVIKIGDNVSIISSWRRSTAAPLAFPARLRVFGPGASIEIGEESQLSGVSITARSTRITLGKRCLLAPNCIITDSDFHEYWPVETRSVSPGYEHDKSVEIEDFVWIGMRSMILKGVKIGRGAIIGAGSIVTGNIPENTVACGVPAKVIRVLDEKRITDL